MLLLDRLDVVILRGEKVAVAAVLAVMGGVVFLDVVNRTVADLGTGGRVGLVAGGAVLGALGALSRKPAASPALGAAVGAAAGVAGAVMPVLFVNGLVWSQPLALALTLWLGTIGASIAAYERRHLALDIGSKLWPAWLAPKIAALGHLVTAGFCLVLLWLASRSLFGYDLDGQPVQGHLEVWTASEGTAGNLSGTAIPKWVAVAAIPYGMVMLTFRFTLEAVKTWLGQIATGGDDTLHQLGIKDTGAAS